jgi:hypothetical protein
MNSVTMKGINVVARVPPGRFQRMGEELAYAEAAGKAHDEWPFRNTLRSARTWRA